MKSLLTIMLFVFYSFSFCQNSNSFKAKIYIEDNSLTGGGSIVFPLTKDTVHVDTSGLAVINLEQKENRVFYLVWTNWKSKIFRFADGICSDSIYKVFVPDTLFYAHYQKLHLCPICQKTKDVVPIIFGLPSPELFKQAKEGKVILGGCLVYDYSPTCFCSKDNFEF